MKSKVYTWVATIDCKQSSIVGSKNPSAMANCASDIGRGTYHNGKSSEITSRSVLNLYDHQSLTDTISRIGDAGVLSIVSSIGETYDKKPSMGLVGKKQYKGSITIRVSEII